jgi:hypothetical protein
MATCGAPRGELSAGLAALAVLLAMQTWAGVGSDGAFRPPSLRLPCPAPGGRSRRWCGRSALHLVLRAALVVLGDRLVLEQLLQVLVGVAAHCARPSWLLAACAPPWSVPCGALRSGRASARAAGHPGHEGFRPRSDSRMAFSILAPMPFSQGCTLIVRASSRRHVGHLADRHHRAVVVDVHLVQDARVGAAGADLVQFVLERPRRTCPSCPGRSS